MPKCWVILVANTPKLRDSPETPLHMPDPNSKNQDPNPKSEVRDACQVGEKRAVIIHFSHASRSKGPNPKRNKICLGGDFASALTQEPQDVTQGDHLGDRGGVGGGH